MTSHDDTRDARLARVLTVDFEQERAPRESDARALEDAVAAALRARAPDRMRESGERLMVRVDARDPREPRVAAAVQTPGPQPAIQVIRRPAPPPAPMSRFAVAAAAIVGIALGAGAVAGGGVVLASVERERAIAEEVAREDALAGTIAPAPATVSIEVTPTPAPALPPLAAARELLAQPATEGLGSRWLVTARDALDEDDPELAERVLRSVVRRWPRGEEAGTARLALAEIYAATNRPREASAELERWLRWNRRAERAPAVEARIVALRDRY